jgi:RNA polymerase sigma factor (sigma-70 family)
MSNCEFSDGMKLLLRRHPALPAERTRELSAAFTAAQAVVCHRLAALAYPLDRVVQELKAGHLEYFREGSDQDRKHNSGKKTSYRFAGFTRGHVEEYDWRRNDPRGGRFGALLIADWQASFLPGFTFEVIEQVALRALPAPAGTETLRAELAAALSRARGLRDEIITGNLLLVAKIACQRGRFHPAIVVDDLFTAGTDGLMIAACRYDPTVGQFSTYAMPWVKMAIDRFVAKTRYVIRIPIGLQEKVRRQHRLAGGETEGAGEDLCLIPQVQSMEEPLSGFGDDELKLEDVVADLPGLRPREAVEQDDIARILHARVLQLDTLKQFVIAMRNDIGDAGALAARLFREEAALSQARGRATCLAAGKTVDEPARVRLISRSEALAEPYPQEPAPLAFAV